MAAEEREGRGRFLVLAPPDKRAEAIGMSCHCPTGTSHPQCFQELDKMRNMVQRNLGKGKPKDARQMQTLLSGANSDEQPPYR